MFKNKLATKQKANIPLSMMGKTTKVPPGSARPEIGLKASIRGKSKK